MNTKEKKEFNIQFWRFLWASILIGLSACLGNVVDAMIVGNLIDEDSVSAINLSLPSFSLCLLSTCCWLRERACW